VPCAMFGEVNSYQLAMLERTCKELDVATPARITKPAPKLTLVAQAA